MAPTQQPTSTPPARQSVFTLDISLVEQEDPAALVNLTDDGCGSTCTACTTGVV